MSKRKVPSSSITNSWILTTPCCECQCDVKHSSLVNSDNHIPQMFCYLLDKKVLCARCARVWRIPIFKSNGNPEITQSSGGFHDENWNLSVQYSLSTLEPIRTNKRLSGSLVKLEGYMTLGEYENNISLRLDFPNLLKQMTSEDIKSRARAPFVMVECGDCGARLGWLSICKHDGKKCVQNIKQCLYQKLSGYNLKKWLKF